MKTPFYLNSYIDRPRTKKYKEIDQQKKNILLHIT